MICPKCNTNNNYYHVYCYQCGNKLLLSDKNDMTADDYATYTNTAKIILNTETNKNVIRANAFHKILPYVGMSLLGVFFVVMLAVILSNVRVKQLMANAPTPLPIRVTPVPSQPMEKVMLRIQDPQNASTETDQETYRIIMESVPSAIVKIGGSDIESSGEGIWIKDVPLVLGENTFDVEAQCKGFLTANETIRITRVAVPPVLILDATSQTNLSTVRITGKTDPNAILSASLPVVGKPAIDAQGNFELTVQLPVIPGEYSVTVKAAASGKETSAEQKLVRLWNEKEYSAAAGKVSFADLASNPQNWRGKVLEITGTVYSIASNDDGSRSFTFLFNSKRTQKILVEYNGKAKFRRGNRRRLFCEIKEIKDGKPVLTARVVK